MKRWQRAGITVGAIALAGCFGHAPTPLARVQFGPAREFFAQRVIALPSTCLPAGSMCDVDYLRAVDAQLRMELEFHGHTVIDSESLNVRPVAFTQKVTKNSFTSSVGDETATKTVETTVAKQLFADASPEIQKSVLDDLMIDGWVTSQIVISGLTSINNTRALQVNVEFSRRQDAVKIWTSRCEVVSGLHLSQAVAMSRTMQCALESVYDAMQRTQPRGGL
jgi:hypothetical protein